MAASSSLKPKPLRGLAESGAKAKNGADMKVDLSVFDPNEDRKIAFHEYKFAHVGCGAMENKYVAAHEEFVLRCGCGLEIHVPRFSDARNIIGEVTTDHQPRDLAPASFHSNLANAIRVHASDTV